MNIKTNDKLHRQIMKAMKARIQLAETAKTQEEREEHLKAVLELSLHAGILNNRI
jgi:hypothetical protein